MTIYTLVTVMRLRTLEMSLGIDSTQSPLRASSVGMIEIGYKIWLPEPKKVVHCQDIVITQAKLPKNWCAS